MRPYRQRIAVQKQYRPKKQKSSSTKTAPRASEAAAKKYVLRAISMYRDIAGKFEPFSTEQEICQREILRYTADLEVLDRGTYEERKEVIERYGQKH